MSYVSHEGLMGTEPSSKRQGGTDNCDAKPFHFSSACDLGVPSTY